MRIPAWVLAGWVAMSAGLAGVGIVSAYTGGPLRVVIEGYEPREAKVFYRVFHDDESGSPPDVHFFDLRGPQPSKAMRAPSLEDSCDYCSGTATTRAWRALVRRLVPLEVDSRPEVTFRATASPAEGTGPNGEPRYFVTVEIDSKDHRGHETVEAWCRPLVGVRGVYRIPGRTELLVVLSRIGRAYGCEEVELPVLLP